MKRCFWVDEKSEIYKKYHDEEWGKPKYDDRDLFELLILEGFQAGLSWLTVLKKRNAFKKAYENFDIRKVANFDENKIAEMLANKDIIRSEQKIRASIFNAKILKHSLILCLFQSFFILKFAKKIISIEYL